MAIPPTVGDNINESVHYKIVEFSISIVEEGVV